MRGAGAHTRADRSVSVPKPGRWSLAALWLAGIGVGVSTWFILEMDSDPGGVLWPLVVAPAVIALVPALVPRSGVRLAAAVAMGIWCGVTGFSIGMFLTPALVALVGAALREER